jgi:transcriptional regulator with XRE-family HTH domain
MTGMHLSTFKTYENPDVPAPGSGDTYLRISNALRVPIDELLRTDFPELPDPTHGKKADFKGDNETNIVARYRKAQSLTFSELGVRIGNVSRQAAKMACKRNAALSHHIKLLSIYEGVTPKDLIKKYEASAEGSK